MNPAAGTLPADVGRELDAVLAELIVLLGGDSPPQLAAA